LATDTAIQTTTDLSACSDALLADERIGHALSAQDNAAGAGTIPTPLINLKARMNAVERGLIEWAVGVAKGNKAAAARILTIGRTTLVEKMRKHGMPLNPPSGDARVQMLEMYPDY
jgi:DNA-binding NtrC family response regulator